MRYRLRTLMIILALGPPVMAGIWFVAWKPTSDAVSEIHLPPPDGLSD
jgi:hypothetical protein